MPHTVKGVGRRRPRPAVAIRLSEDFTTDPEAARPDMRNSMILKYIHVVAWNLSTPLAADVPERP